MSIILAAAVAAATASGEFKASERPPIAPKYAAAYETRDIRDARKKAIEVILTDAPVDAAAAAADLDAHTHVINQESLRDRNYIILVVRPDGDVSMNATYSARMVQFIDSTWLSLKAELTENTPGRVAGRVWSPKPVKTQDGETWSVDLRFAADVTRLAAGTKLAAGGGAPGKALRALMASESEETFLLPKKNAKITGGELRGDTAILEVEGEIFEGMKGLVLVRMVKSETGWIFDRATRAGFID